MNEEITIETPGAEHGGEPLEEQVIAKDAQQNVIARSPQATKQSVGITSGDKIAAPFGLAMTIGKSSEYPFAHDEVEQEVGNGGDDGGAGDGEYPCPNDV